jgi:hypothetical protein
MGNGTNIAVHLLQLVNVLNLLEIKRDIFILQQKDNVVYVVMKFMVVELQRKTGFVLLHIKVLRIFLVKLTINGFYKVNF